MLLSHLEKLLQFLQRAIDGSEVPEKVVEGAKPKRRAISGQALNILNR